MAITSNWCRDHASRQASHCTPKLPASSRSAVTSMPAHGSWLNMAESELAILSTLCLDRRISDRRSLQRQVAAWLCERSPHNIKADWRFTAADARIKLKRLYLALFDSGPLG